MREGQPDHASGIALAFEGGREGQTCIMGKKQLLGTFSRVPNVCLAGSMLDVQKPEPTYTSTSAVADAFFGLFGQVFVCITCIWHIRKLSRSQQNTPTGYASHSKHLSQN